MILCFCSVYVRIWQSDEADEMIEKAITGFRASVLRVLANRRLWANRFDPLHPGLLLLQNVIRQTGRRRKYRNRPVW